MARTAFLFPFSIILTPRGRGALRNVLISCLAGYGSELEFNSSLPWLCTCQGCCGAVSPPSGPRSGTMSWGEGADVTHCGLSIQSITVGPTRKPQRYQLKHLLTTVLLEWLWALWAQGTVLQVGDACVYCSEPAPAPWRTSVDLPAW